MIELDPDRVPLFKLILHSLQIVIGFVFWVLEIAVFTGKDAKVVGNNGWAFGVVSNAALIQSSFCLSSFSPYTDPLPLVNSASSPFPHGSTSS